MDVAEYRNELASKALEKIDHLHTDWKNGKIGALSMRHAVNSIWWITCGLVDRKTQAVIDQINAEVEEMVKNAGLK